ncbi:hypothetical protein [Flavivirga spongiicola]|uniref:Uncharacterized protein n=1 Tax=Flavivirga spongiicola TaxID=421621 RepID=A0ABU7XMD0_9FLAO|nr:hypothetical protein [Flavivirga sp. MEBiC05379]MDO5981566.1 hypothetical protein [Flavivirga sp. MEBiC05379]
MKQIGIRIEDIENVKTNTVQLPKGTLSSLEKKYGKTPSDYIIKYLNSTKLYEEIFIKFTHYVHNTLPKKIKSSCLYCNGDSKNQSDKKCTNYGVEANTNLFFASHHFVTIVENNKHLINKPEDLKQLTLNFFECFLFNNGRVIYNIDKMTMYCLRVGFKTLSQLFTSDEPLNNMNNIIDTLDSLNSQFLEFKMFNDEIPIHLEPQIDFFNNKLNTYKTKHFINQELKKRIKDEINIENIKSKQEKILPKLIQYKFNELEKVKHLNIKNLSTHIVNSNLPYQIAYLYYLGFIDSVLKNYCKSQSEMQKLIAKILDSNARSIRGNINGLKNEKSKDKKRYTAYLHTNKVIEHYQSLK